MHTLNAAHVLYRYSYIDESTFIVSRCLRKNIKNSALDFQGQFQNSRHYKRPATKLGFLSDDDKLR